MAVTTRQIFDELQSGGITSQTPKTVDDTGNSLKSVQTAWNTLLSGSGTDGAAYFDSKGLTAAYMATVTDTNFTGVLSSELAKTKTLSTQSQKELSPRMQVCDSYKSARQKLQDTDLGAALYDKMFNIHSTTFLAGFKPVNDQAAVIIAKIADLQTALTAHPITPGVVVPPATTAPPVVDPAVESATIALKVETDKQPALNTALQSLAKTANDAEPSTMDEYLKYISNANLAKVLPDWYKDSNKTAIIDSAASSTLISLL